ETARAEEHLSASRSLLVARPSPLDLGFVVVEEARCALQKGDTELASSKAREGVELLATGAVPGQLGDAYLVLARVYDELGDGERAEWAYTAAIDAIHRQTGWTRELAKAYRWYGKFLKRMGRAEGALEAVQLAGGPGAVHPGAAGPNAPVRRQQLDDASRAYGVASGGAGGSTSTSTGSPAGSGAPRQLSSVIRSLRYWITSRPTATSGSATSTPDIP